MLLGLFVLLLVVFYAVGASLAYGDDTGNHVPGTIVVFVAPIIALSAVVWVIQHWRIPARQPISPAQLARAGMQTFAVFPFAEFISSVDAVRWQQGISTPVGRLAPEVRPIIQTEPDAVTIWASIDAPSPITRIPAEWVQSVSLQNLRIQISRIPIKDRVACIVLELMIRRTPVTVVLPPCNPADQLGTPTPAQLVKWTTEMRATLKSGVPERHNP